MVEEDKDTGPESQNKEVMEPGGYASRTVACSVVIWDTFALLVGSSIRIGYSASAILPASPILSTRC